MLIKFQFGRNSEHLPKSGDQIYDIANFRGDPHLATPVNVAIKVIFLSWTA